LTTGKKIFLSLLVLAAIGVTTSLVNLKSLSALRDENREIINRDLKMLRIADRIIDEIIVFEYNINRYNITGSKETLRIITESREELERLIKEISNFNILKSTLVENFLSFLKEFKVDTLRSGSKEIKRVEQQRKELLSLVREVKEGINADINARSERSRVIIRRARNITLILGVIALLVVSAVTMVITRHISKSMWNLRTAIEEFSAGRFEYKHSIHTTDEFGALSDAFSEMSRRLKKLEEMYLDASPLTRFPGGIAIENILRKRIESNIPFAFCMFDMDNFKSFNDKYGYHRGSEVIKMLAGIIGEIVQKREKDYDFVGHIGGDDFVVITSPEDYAAICSEIINRFDSRIPEFYDPEDRKRGYITGKTRQGEIARFPIISLSVVVVTNRHRKIVSPVQVGEIAAELKEQAKQISGSKLIVDKRSAG
jgi:GGDEF domain-containing protein/CHASE3 domain sensor protein